jgi:hypothetical protein
MGGAGGMPLLLPIYLIKAHWKLISQSHLLMTLVGLWIARAIGLLGSACEFPRFTTLG